jgi:hypothetical protein
MVSSLEAYEDRDGLWHDMSCELPWPYQRSVRAEKSCLMPSSSR